MYRIHSCGKLVVSFMHRLQPKWKINIGLLYAINAGKGLSSPASFTAFQDFTF